MKRQYLGLLTVFSIAVLGGSEALAKAPPANARLPQSAGSMDAILDQTAAVIEGEVSDITSTYDEKSGPWTQVTLTRVKAHLGEVQEPRLTLRVRGGPLPDGRVIVIPELPSFVRGKRYLVFLRNTSWSWSPVIGDLALRFETVAGREVLVDSRGLPCVGMDTAGLRFGDKALFVPTMEARLQGVAPAEQAGNRVEDVRAAVSGADLAQQLKGELTSRRRSLDVTFFDEPAPRKAWSLTPATAAGAQRQEATLMPTKATPEPDAAPRQ
jgi:hypothetical protein